MGDSSDPSIRTSDDFTEAVLAVVAEIPEGCALTYGQVAAVIGSRSARGVGRVMAHYGHSVAWWRVVRSGGFPPLGHEEIAREHYEAEDTPLVELSGGRYRLARTALPE
ncbi:MGMT family protein [Plantibacter sp. Mn2098]|uniref:MGMT family protein n=1 Tax=Plantibacter sp. Mn2098 TaxID=3395266 RepID=UPI003BCE2C9A